MKNRTLIEESLHYSKTGLLNELELANLIPGTADMRYGKVKRALAKKQLIHLRRGLYAISPPYRQKPYNLFEVAGHLYAPSYISFESALSYHGWIPESVPITSSATPKRKRSFNNALGTFQYLTVPKENAFCEVSRIENEDGQVFFIASPWKAIFDYIYVFNQNWQTLDPLFNSLRIEPEDLILPSNRELKSIATQYKSNRITRFMSVLEKEFNR